MWRFTCGNVKGETRLLAREWLPSGFALFYELLFNSFALNGWQPEDRSRFIRRDTGDS